MRQRFLLVATVLGVILLAQTGFGQAGGIKNNSQSEAHGEKITPNGYPKLTANPVLSEEQKAKLLSTYKSILIVANRGQADKLQVAIDDDLIQHKLYDWNQLREKTLKDAGFPEGTLVNVDADKDQVTTTTPPAASGPVIIGPAK